MRSRRLLGTIQAMHIYTLALGVAVALLVAMMIYAPEPTEVDEERP